MDITKKATYEVSKLLRGEEEVTTEKWVADRANNAKNILKHGSSRLSESVEFDAEEEAKDMLQRAIDNYEALTGRLTDNMLRFVRRQRSNNALPLTVYNSNEE